MSLRIFFKDSEMHIAQARFKICQSCPSFNNNWCGKRLIPTATTCGCYMPVKVQMINVKCPQKKW